jgi:peroxiredoxin Q/BCP
VWVEKARYGRDKTRPPHAQRATFVIDAGGTVARVFPRVSPKTHDEVVLAALDELAAAA